MKSTYKILVGTAEGNEQITGPRYRGYDIIKVNLKNKTVRIRLLVMVESLC
jgi:hypothetical protein